MRKFPTILQLFAWVAVFGAAVYLALTSPPRRGDFDLLRVVAAAVAAIPSAVALGKIAKEYVRPRQGAELALQNIQQSLVTGLLTISRNRSFVGDATRVSFHVWLLPSWYRRSYRLWLGIRRMVKPKRVSIPTNRRPKLHKLVSRRLDQRNISTGVTFRKGRGLVGWCVHDNRKRVYVVRFNSNAFKAAMENRATWRAARADVQYELELWQAERLAEAYSQAAAVVLRAQNSDPIGCLTLSLPADAKTHFKRTTGNKGSTGDFLIDVLESTAEQVENQLLKSGPISV
jgi:hypothetical protein